MGRKDEGVEEKMKDLVEVGFEHGLEQATGFKQGKALARRCRSLLTR